MRPQAIRLAPVGHARYEAHDIRIAYVVWTAASVAAILVALAWYLTWLEPYLFRGGHGDKSPVSSEQGRPPLHALPPAPLLEVAARGDFADIQAAWQTQLTTYGRDAAGSWRIPVTTAMTLLAARGLPVTLHSSEQIKPPAGLPPAPMVSLTPRQPPARAGEPAGGPP